MKHVDRTMGNRKNGNLSKIKIKNVKFWRQIIFIKLIGKLVLVTKRKGKPQSNKTVVKQ